MKKLSTWAVLSILMVGLAGCNGGPMDSSSGDGSVRVEIGETSHALAFSPIGNALSVTCPSGSGVAPFGVIESIQVVYKDGSVISAPFNSAGMIIPGTKSHGEVKWMTFHPRVYKDCRLDKVSVSGEPGHWEGEWYTY